MCPKGNTFLQDEIRPVPLGLLRDEAELIDRHDELRVALDQCWGARQLTQRHPNASIALCYLAVEGLVTHVLGSATGSLASPDDWRNAAPLLSSQPESLERLYLSAQLGRHIDPQRARRKLEDRGWDPLGPGGCCEVSLDIISSYANDLLVKAQEGAVETPDQFSEALHATIAANVAANQSVVAEGLDPASEMDD